MFGWWIKEISQIFTWKVPYLALWIRLYILQGCVNVINLNYRRRKKNAMFRNFVFGLPPLFQKSNRARFLLFDPFLPNASTLIGFISQIMEILLTQLCLAFHWAPGFQHRIVVCSLSIFQQQFWKQQIPWPDCAHAQTGLGLCLSRFLSK